MANTPKSTKNTRAATKAKLEEERRRQRAADRRRTQLWVGLSVVGILIFAGIVGYAVQNQRSDKGELVKPPSATANWGIQVGQAAAPVTMQAYEDFQCPNCQSFEQQSGPTIKQMIDTGKSKVIFHTLRFIDFNVGGDYSLRAANAATCADESGKFLDYHAKLYANFPGEGTGGLSNDQLIAMGKDVGVTGDSFASCVNDKKYDAWVQRVQEEASKAGINATPTVLVDGQKVQDLSPQGLTKAVAAATTQ